MKSLNQVPFHPWGNYKYIYIQQVIENHTFSFKPLRFLLVIFRKHIEKFDLNSHEVLARLGWQSKKTLVQAQIGYRGKVLPKFCTSDAPPSVKNLGDSVIKRKTR